MRVAMIAWGMVRARSLVIAMIAAGAILGGLGLAACTFDDPDFGDTHFDCDADHPCPTGQVCTAGRCEEPTSIGTVACGADTCSGGAACCASALEDTCAAIESCPGPGATCDEVEDCSAGRCCTIDAAENVIGCGPATCEDPICLHADDCPIERAQCCNFPGNVEPWGHCVPVGTCVGTPLP
jgi:hypothetical protein